MGLLPIYAKGQCQFMGCPPCMRAQWVSVCRLYFIKLHREGFLAPIAILYSPSPHNRD